MPAIPRPRAVLFDLFDTLVRAITLDGDEPATWVELGIPIDVWQRRWFDHSDGRAAGRVPDPFEALRIAVHDMDPTLPLERIATAFERRARRFEKSMLEVEPAILAAVASLRARGVRTAVVSWLACVLAAWLSSGG